MPPISFISLSLYFIFDFSFFLLFRIRYFISSILIIIFHFDAFFFHFLFSRQMWFLFIYFFDADAAFSLHFHDIFDYLGHYFFHYFIWLFFMLPFLSRFAMPFHFAYHFTFICLLIFSLPILFHYEALIGFIFIIDAGFIILFSLLLAISLRCDLMPKHFFAFRRWHYHFSFHFLSFILSFSFHYFLSSTLLGQPSRIFIIFSSIFSFLFFISLFVLDYFSSLHSRLISSSSLITLIFANISFIIIAFISFIIISPLDYFRMPPFIIFIIFFFHYDYLFFVRHFRFAAISFLLLSLYRLFLRYYSFEDYHFYFYAFLFRRLMISAWCGGIFDLLFIISIFILFFSFSFLIRFSSFSHAFIILDAAHNISFHFFLIFAFLSKTLIIFLPLRYQYWLIISVSLFDGSYFLYHYRRFLFFRLIISWLIELHFFFISP